MSPAEYLERLSSRLAAGVARLPEETRSRHAAFLLAAQNADGGFSGREGGSDLYYTGFGLRGLAVLAALSPDVCDRAAGFLRQSLRQEASVVDFYSLLYGSLLVEVGGGTSPLADSPAGWPDRVAAALESLRTPDGGYAKSADGASGSTYHTFLVGLCYGLLGRPVPSPDAVRSFLLSRRREDGGFVELAPMRRGGTNPTAAAVGALQFLGGGGDVPADVGEGVIAFLADMPSPAEGGLRANARAPLADLLSTFTGGWTLDQLGSLGRLDRDAVLHYAQALELPAGGFRGGLWDDRTDVEYTFYGLGVLALLTA